MRRFKAINSRTEEGAAWSLPLSNRERDMDAKTRDLALLAFLSVFCAGVPGFWITLFWVRSFLCSAESPLSA